MNSLDLKISNFASIIKITEVNVFLSGTQFAGKLKLLNLKVGDQIACKIF